MHLELSCFNLVCIAVMLADSASKFESALAPWTVHPATLDGAQTSGTRGGVMAAFIGDIRPIAKFGVRWTPHQGGRTLVA